MSIFPIASTIAITAALAVGPAQAGQSVGPGQGASQQQGAAQQQGQSQMQISGEILQQKLVQVKGQDRQHIAVLIKTKDGNRVVADLGPKQNLKDMELRTGEQIQVTGHLGRVSDRVALFASQIQGDTGTIEIERPQQEQQVAQQQQQAAGGEEAEIAAFTKGEHEGELKGKIIQEKDVQNLQTKQPHRVVLVQTEQGQGYVVDLGPTQRTEAAQTSRGTPIEVQGRLMKVGDRLILVANQASIGGQQFDIQSQGQAGQKKQ